MKDDSGGKITFDYGREDETVYSCPYCNCEAELVFNLGQTYVVCESCQFDALLVDGDLRQVKS